MSHQFFLNRFFFFVFQFSQIISKRESWLGSFISLYYQPTVEVDYCSCQGYTSLITFSHLSELITETIWTALDILSSQLLELVTVAIGEGLHLFIRSQLLELTTAAFGVSRHFLQLQAWAQYLEQSKEIKSRQTVTWSFDISFCITFGL